jgi:hypothetical protein
MGIVPTHLDLMHRLVVTVAALVDGGELNVGHGGRGR